MRRFISAFGSGLCPRPPVLPVPLLGRESFGWDRRGARGERDGGSPGGGDGGVRVAGVGTARRSSASPQSRGPAPTANNPRGRSGTGVAATRPPGYLLRGRPMAELGRSEEEGVLAPSIRLFRGLRMRALLPSPPRAAAAHAFRSDF